MPERPAEDIPTMPEPIAVAPTTRRPRGPSTAFIIVLVALLALAAVILVRVLLTVPTTSTEAGLLRMLALGAFLGLVAVGRRSGRRRR